MWESPCAFASRRVAIEIQYFSGNPPWFFFSCVHTYIHTHIHTHTYTYTYIHTRTRIRCTQYSFLVHGVLKTTGIIMCIMVGIIGEDMVHLRTVFLYLTGERALRSTYYRWCLRAMGDQIDVTFAGTFVSTATAVIGGLTPSSIILLSVDFHRDNRSGRAIIDRTEDQAESCSECEWSEWRGDDLEKSKTTMTKSRRQDAPIWDSWEIHRLFAQPVILSSPLRT